MTLPKLSRPSRWAVAFCIATFFATMWPIYPLFSDVHPIVLGIPLSLFYLVLVIAAVFSVMLSLFLWEARNDKIE